MSFALDKYLESIGKLEPIGKLAQSLGVHVSSIYRWGSPKGVRGHRLILLRIGGRTYVRSSDWEKFLHALNDTSDTTTVSTEKAASTNKVEDQLDAAGL